MKYLVFTTEAEAIAAEAQIDAARGYPVAGQNAQTGQPEPAKQQTTDWAIPRQILDGRWVIPSPDDTGVEDEPTWWSEFIIP